jgi:regulator of protease activity HflC (stomatin/prohibitin superfamily)
MSAFSVSRTLVGGAAVFCFSKSFEVVRQGDVAVVERLGKFHKRLDPGLHVIVPFIDQVRGTLTSREQVFDIPPQKCITSDNAPLAADAVVYWRVVDPYKALYSVVNLEMAIQNLVLTQLRSEIGKLTLDMTFSAREQINAILLKDLDVATDPWGIKISRVEGKKSVWSSWRSQNALESAHSSASWTHPDIRSTLPSSRHYSKPRDYAGHGIANGRRTDQTRRHHQVGRGAGACR